VYTSTYLNGTVRVINIASSEFCVFVSSFRSSLNAHLLRLSPSRSIGKRHGIETCLGGRNDKIYAADCASPVAAVRFLSLSLLLIGSVVLTLSFLDLKHSGRSAAPTVASITVILKEYVVSKRLETEVALFSRISTSR